MTEIAGAIAVVTGGAVGIGRGIAEELLAQGATVIIADIDKHAVAVTAAEIGATPMVVDVGDSESVQRLADEVVRLHGGVDILVNNAGVGPMAPIADLTLEDWNWIVQVNLFGVIHGVHAFLPLLQAGRRRAHIVNTGSMASFAPNSPLGAYGVTKAGVWALTEVLAQEMLAAGDHIGVTLLAPGNVHSEISTSQRNRPTRGGLQDVDLSQQPASFTRETVWLHPRQVGAIVARAIQNNDQYAITHPSLWGRVESRSETLRRAFGAYPDVVDGFASVDDAAADQDKEQ